MIKTNKIQSGQGLVEAIFAIGILLIVVSAVMALTVSNIVGQKESEFQIIANNLAREGIEVVRSIRDSNWLANKDWDAGLVDDPSGATNRAVAEFDNNVWTLSFDESQERLLYISTDGVYSHNNKGDPSAFRRELILGSICRDGAGNEVIKFSADNFECSVNEQKVGIRVSARVEWSGRGRDRTVTIEDLLYDWK